MKRTRYERIMLACINSLPFKFHSPGEPNIPNMKKYEPTEKEHSERQHADYQTTHTSTKNLRPYKPLPSSKKSRRMN